MRAAIALLFLAACTPHAAAIADTDNAADGSAADAGSPLLESAPATAAPDASAIDLAADGGLAAILSGAVPAARLAEVSTDPGQPLDPDLRERLTTRAAGADDAVHVTVKGVSATSPMADAERVVAALRPQARACYRLGLQNDPTLAGKLVIAAQIGSSGAVGDARIAQNVGLSPEVARCVARGYENATFAPPAGPAGATLTVTLTFASGS